MQHATDTLMQLNVRNDLAKAKRRWMEKNRFHDSSRFRKKAGDAKLPFYHSFVPVLMSLAAESCRSRAESVHLLKPHLQWGKG